MNEQYFKVIFMTDEGRPTYACEGSSFEDEVDVVNTLFQGFIRCVNNLKKGFFGWDEECARLLLDSIRSLAMDAIGEERKIHDRWSNGEKDMLSLFAKVQIAASPYSPPHSKVSILAQTFREVEKGEDGNQVAYVQYRLIYGPNGPVMMYDTSLRVMNELQVASYGALLKHLLPGLTPAGLRVLATLIAGAFIAIETGKFHWKKTLEMHTFICVATAYLMLHWDRDMCNGLYQDEYDFLNRMMTALPELK